MSVFVGETTERASFVTEGRSKQQVVGSCSWCLTCAVSLVTFHKINKVIRGVQLGI